MESNWSVSDEFAALLDDEKAWEEKAPLKDPMAGVGLIESPKQKRKQLLIPHYLLGRYIGLVLGI